MPHCVIAGRAALALCLGRALDSHETVELLSPVGLHRANPAGYWIRTSTHLSMGVAGAGLPRLRLEFAALAVASRADNVTQIASVLCEAVNSRRTTAQRLLATLADHPRIRHRMIVRSVLLDLLEGTNSVVERHYRDRVERAHGLSRSRQQVQHLGPTGTRYHDFDDATWSLAIEIDGYEFHSSSGARDKDLRRDLDNKLASLDTIRLSFAQVSRDPCATATLLARLFAIRGWTGHATKCSPSCPLGHAVST